MAVLLDSVIVIDYLNEIAKAGEYVEQVKDEAVLSVVTRAEVLVGVEESDLARVVAFLDYFPLLSIDRDISDLAAALRREHGWKLPDAFQAALAQHHGCEFATRNTDDFDPEKHDFVVVPYER